MAGWLWLCILVHDYYCVLCGWMDGWMVWCGWLVGWSVFGSVCNRGGVACGLPRLLSTTVCLSVCAGARFLSVCLSACQCSGRYVRCLPTYICACVCRCSFLIYCVCMPSVCVCGAVYPHLSVGLVCAQLMAGWMDGRT